MNAEVVCKQAGFLRQAPVMEPSCIRKKQCRVSSPLCSWHGSTTPSHKFPSPKVDKLQSSFCKDVGPSKTASEFPLELLKAGSERQKGARKLFRVQAHSSVSSNQETNQRAVEKVLTATRIGDTGSVRIMGPGTELPNGFGPFLSLDEFFLAPSQSFSFPTNVGLLESLAYFLEDPQTDTTESNHPADDLATVSESSSEIDQPRHGLQILFRSAFQAVDSSKVGTSSAEETVLHQPIISHGRETAFVESVNADGVEVKVVAGHYGETQLGPPLDRFRMLDVTMRRDSRLDIPVSSEGGALVYVLEGVGLFGGETAGVASGSYQNEGHALWLPPSSAREGQEGDEDVLLIRTNKMSGLRFVLLSSETS